MILVYILPTYMLSKSDIIEFLTNFYFVQDATKIPMFKDTLSKVIRSTANLNKQNRKYSFILELLRDIETYQDKQVPNMEYRLLEACRTLRE